MEEQESNVHENLPPMMFPGGVWGSADSIRIVSTKEALKAAEAGNSVDLAVFLHGGGDPQETRQTFSLLHLAAGCGGIKNNETTRPAPLSADGYATSVSLLIAAGANVNARAEGGYRAIDGACLVGDVECCRLLLQAGSKPPRHFPLPSFDEQHVRMLPRSPINVSARLLDAVDKSEERDRDVEVRWKLPEQSSECGEIQRYVVRSYSNGRLGEVVHSAAGPGRRNRRDFCENSVVDRGIALRKNLGLVQPNTASTLLHGLMPGVTYHFAVSSIAEIEGKVRESPPSLMSKPLEIPAVEEEEWNMGEILDKVFAHGLVQTPSMITPPQVQEHLPTSTITPPPLAAIASSLSGGTSAVSKERETVVVKSYWDEFEEDDRSEETLEAIKVKQREQQRLFEQEAAEKLRVAQLLAEMRGKKQAVPSQVDSGENGNEECIIS